MSVGARKSLILNRQKRMLEAISPSPQKVWTERLYPNVVGIFTNWRKNLETQLSLEFECTGWYFKHTVRNVY